VKGWLYDGALQPIMELDATGAVTTRFVAAAPLTEGTSSECACSGGFGLNAGVSTVVGGYTEDIPTLAGPGTEAGSETLGLVVLGWSPGGDSGVWTVGVGPGIGADVHAYNTVTGEWIYPASGDSQRSRESK